jgi:plasmid stability protein
VSAVIVLRHRREGIIIAILTVRKVPEEVHSALEARARARGHSMEAEVRLILDDAVNPQSVPELGSFLAGVGKEVGLTDDDIEVFEDARDRSPARVTSFT